MASTNPFSDILSGKTMGNADFFDKILGRTSAPAPSANTDGIENTIGELSSMQGWFMGAQLGQAIISAVGQIWTGILRSDMVKRGLAHAEAMHDMEYGKHDEKGNLIEGGMAQYEMNAQKKLNADVDAIAREGMNVTEQRVAAEERKAVQSELYVEAKKTEKAGAIDQSPLDDLLPDPRRPYGRGSPEPEVHA